MKNQKKFRFAFVSNSKEIGAMVKTFCNSTIEEMELHQSTMEEAVPVARELLEAHVEVVLGGGATGKLLRNSLDQPVVTIARTPLDVLRTLIQAKGFSHDIALTSFDLPMEGVNLFENLLNIRVRQLVFRTTEELVEGIEQLAADGVGCVVGSGICREICQTLSLKAFIIYPSKNVVIRALEEARAIAAAQRRERKDAQQLSAILHTITEGVIGINASGAVTICNATAAEMLNVEANKIIGAPFPEIARGMGMIKVLDTATPEIDQIRRIAGQDMVINTFPVTIEGNIQAVVSSFKLASRIQSIDRKLKEQLYAKGFVARYTFEDLKGSSSGLQRLKLRAAQYANTNASVLIYGETGTGKEILSQAIHNHSQRRRKPFIAVNCSALPESLLESELFGYEEGAFTGAKRGGKPGLFELANEGTIFLDEISDIPTSVQVRLLRVIEAREVMRVGGDRIIPVNVRVISATLRDLATAVREGKFRLDLFFRLAVLQLNLPPIRDRGHDVPLLLSVLLQRHGLQKAEAKYLLTKEVLYELSLYHWPGNVRELDSLVRRFIALCDNIHEADESLLIDLLRETRSTGLNVPCLKPQFDAGDFSIGPLKTVVAEFEREVITRALANNDNDRHKAAHQLGISVNTLWRKTKN